MTFDQAAVDTFFDNLLSHALSLNLFDRVNTSEPKAAPGNGLTCAIWIQRMRPLGAQSGLDAASGVVVANVRLYSNMLSDPQDAIDPNILTAVTTLLASYCGSFTFGESARNLDIFGTSGQQLDAQAGYVTIGNQLHRTITITVPVIFNDMWVMTP